MTLPILIFVFSPPLPPFLLPFSEPYVLCKLSSKVLNLMIDFTSNNVSGNDKQRLIFPLLLYLIPPRPPPPFGGLLRPLLDRLLCRNDAASSSLIVMADIDFEVVVVVTTPALLFDRCLILKLPPIVLMYLRYIGKYGGKQKELVGQIYENLGRSCRDDMIESLQILYCLYWLAGLALFVRLSSLCSVASIAERPMLSSCPAVWSGIGRQMLVRKIALCRSLDWQYVRSGLCAFSSVGPPSYYSLTEDD